MLVPVLLYGILAKKYGKYHKFDVATPSEAVRALRANYPDFEQTMTEYKPGFHVFRGRENLSKGQLDQPSSRDAIRILPAIQGGKDSGGIWQVIAGIVIIIAAVVIDVVGEGAFSSFTSYMYKAGAMMIVGGVVRVLFAPPSPGTTPKEKDANNQPSYVFNGPVNTSAQGHCVPFGAGRMLVGSATVSGGMFVEQIDQNGVGDIGTLRVGPILSGTQ